MRMLVTEEHDEIVDTAEDTGAKLDTRFSIVRDAVANDRSHMDEAIGQFLQTLFTALADFKVDGPDNEPLDERVIHTLTAMKAPRDYFLEFVDVVNQNQRSAAIHPAIRSFLEARWPTSMHRATLFTSITCGVIIIDFCFANCSSA